MAQKPVNLLNLHTADLSARGKLNLSPTDSEISLVQTRIGSATPEERLTLTFLQNLQDWFVLMIRHEHCKSRQPDHPFLLSLAQSLIEARKAFVCSIVSLVQADSGVKHVGYDSEDLRNAQEWAALYDLWDEFSILSRKILKY